jgi:hypothetical protein
MNRCALASASSPFSSSPVSRLLSVYPEVTPYAGPHKSWHFLLKDRFPARVPTSLAVGAVGPFRPRFRRESSHLVGRGQAVRCACRTRVGSQGRRYGWGLNRPWSRRRLSSPGSPRGRPKRWFSLSSRGCRIKFRLTPRKANISRI